MSTVGCERIGGVAEHLSVVESVGSACRRAVGTRPRQVLTGVALTCALLALVAVSAGAAPEEQMFLATSAISQGILSIFVPFYGVLLISDLRRHQASDGLAWWSSFLAAELFAVVAAVYGLVISAVAVAVVVGAGSTAAGSDPWRSVGLVVMGSLIMQLLAASVGTGFGLLLQPPIVAELATIVVPLSCWLLLGLTPVLTQIREWTTPFAAVQHLFTGQLSPLNWLQWLVVIAIWGVGLNAIGSIRLQTRKGNK
jgi:hypothetical protein